MWGEGLLADLLAKYLGAYIRDLAHQRLKFGVWTGHLELEAFELTADALDFLGLPVLVSRSRIGRLRLQVPWTRLLSEPVVLTVEDIEIDLRLKGKVELDGRQHERRERLRKRMLLDLAELASGRAPAAGAGASESRLGQLGARILSNVRVRVRNVHIRHVHTRSPPGSEGLACGLRLQELFVSTADADWLPAVVAPAEDPARARRIIELVALSMYWCATQQARTADARDDHLLRPLTVRARMRAGVQSVPPDLSLQSAGGSRLGSTRGADGRVTDRALELAGAAGGDAPSQWSVVGAAVPEVELALSSMQCAQMTALASRLAFLGLLERYGRLRPVRGVASNARAWWQYGARAVLSDRARHRRPWRTWAALARRRAARLEYTGLWERKLRALSAGQALDAASGARLAELEDELDTEDALFFRALAENAFDRRAAQRARDEAADSWRGARADERSARPWLAGLRLLARSPSGRQSPWPARSPPPRARSASTGSLRSLASGAALSTRRSDAQLELLGAAQPGRAAAVAHALLGAAPEAERGEGGEGGEDGGDDGSEVYWPFADARSTYSESSDDALCDDFEDARSELHGAAEGAQRAGGFSQLRAGGPPPGAAGALLGEDVTEAERRVLRLALGDTMAASAGGSQSLAAGVAVPPTRTLAELLVARVSLTLVHARPAAPSATPLAELVASGLALASVSSADGTSGACAHAAHVELRDVLSARTPHRLLVEPRAPPGAEPRAARPALALTSATTAAAADATAGRGGRSDTDPSARAVGGDAARGTSLRSHTDLELAPVCVVVHARLWARLASAFVGGEAEAVQPDEHVDGVAVVDVEDEVRAINALESLRARMRAKLELLLRPELRDEASVRVLLRAPLLLLPADVCDERSDALLLELAELELSSAPNALHPSELDELAPTPGAAVEPGAGLGCAPDPELARLLTELYRHQELSARALRLAVERGGAGGGRTRVTLVQPFDAHVHVETSLLTADDTFTRTRAALAAQRVDVTLAAGALPRLCALASALAAALDGSAADSASPARSAGAGPGPGSSSSASPPSLSTSLRRMSSGLPGSLGALPPSAPSAHPAPPQGRRARSTRLASAPLAPAQQLEAAGETPRRETIGRARAASYRRGEETGACAGPGGARGAAAAAAELDADARRSAQLLMHACVQIGVLSVSMRGAELDGGSRTPAGDQLPAGPLAAMELRGCRVEVAQGHRETSARLGVRAVHVEAGGAPERARGVRALPPPPPTALVISAPTPGLLSGRDAVAAPGVPRGASPAGRRAAWDGPQCALEHALGAHCKGSACALDAQLGVGDVRVICEPRTLVHVITQLSVELQSASTEPQAASALSAGASGLSPGGAQPGGDRAAPPPAAGPNAGEDAPLAMAAGLSVSSLDVELWHDAMPGPRALLRLGARSMAVTVGTSPDASDDAAAGTGHLSAALGEAAVYSRVASGDGDGERAAEGAAPAWCLARVAAAGHDDDLVDGARVSCVVDSAMAIRSARVELGSSSVDLHPDALRAGREWYREALDAAQELDGTARAGADAHDVDRRLAPAERGSGVPSGSSPQQLGSSGSSGMPPRAAVELALASRAVRITWHSAAAVSCSPEAADGQCSVTLSSRVQLHLTMPASDSDAPPSGELHLPDLGATVHADSGVAEMLRPLQVRLAFGDIDTSSARLLDAGTLAVQAVVGTVAVHASKQTIGAAWRACAWFPEAIGATSSEQAPAEGGLNNPHAVSATPAAVAGSLHCSGVAIFLEAGDRDDIGLSMHAHDLELELRSVALAQPLATVTANADAGVPVLMTVDLRAAALHVADGSPSTSAAFRYPINVRPRAEPGQQTSSAALRVHCSVTIAGCTPSTVVSCTLGTVHCALAVRQVDRLGGLVADALLLSDAAGAAPAPAAASSSEAPVGDGAPCEVFEEATALHMEIDASEVLLVAGACEGEELATSAKVCTAALALNLRATARSSSGGDCLYSFESAVQVQRVSVADLADQFEATGSPSAQQSTATYLNDRICLVLRGQWDDLVLADAARIDLRLHSGEIDLRCAPQDTLPLALLAGQVQLALNELDLSWLPESSRPQPAVSAESMSFSCDVVKFTLLDRGRAPPIQLAQASATGLRADIRNWSALDGVDASMSVSLAFAVFANAPPPTTETRPGSTTPDARHHGLGLVEWRPLTVFEGWPINLKLSGATTAITATAPLSMSVSGEMLGSLRMAFAEAASNRGSGARLSGSVVTNHTGVAMEVWTHAALPRALPPGSSLCLDRDDPTVSPDQASAGSFTVQLAGFDELLVPLAIGARVLPLRPRMDPSGGAPRSDMIAWLYVRCTAEYGGRAVHVSSMVRVLNCTDVEFDMTLSGSSPATPMFASVLPPHSSVSLPPLVCRTRGGVLLLRRAGASNSPHGNVRLPTDVESLGRHLGAASAFTCGPSTFYLHVNCDVHANQFHRAFSMRIEPPLRITNALPVDMRVRFSDGDEALACWLGAGESRGFHDKRALHPRTKLSIAVHDDAESETSEATVLLSVDRAEPLERVAPVDGPKESVTRSDGTSSFSLFASGTPQSPLDVSEGACTAIRERLAPADDRLPPLAAIITARRSSAPPPRVGETAGHAQPASSSQTLVVRVSCDICVFNQSGLTLEYAAELDGRPVAVSALGGLAAARPDPWPGLIELLRAGTPSLRKEWAELGEHHGRNMRPLRGVIEHDRLQLHWRLRGQCAWSKLSIAAEAGARAGITLEADDGVRHDVRMSIAALDKDASDGDLVLLIAPSVIFLNCTRMPLRLHRCSRATGTLLQAQEPAVARASCSLLPPADTHEGDAALWVSPAGHARLESDSPQEHSFRLEALDGSNACATSGVFRVSRWAAPSQAQRHTLRLRSRGDAVSGRAHLLSLSVHALEAFATAAIVLSEQQASSAPFQLSNRSAYSLRFRQRPSPLSPSPQWETLAAHSTMAYAWDEPLARPRLLEVTGLPYGDIEGLGPENISEPSPASARSLAVWFLPSGKPSASAVATYALDNPGSIAHPISLSHTTTLQAKMRYVGIVRCLELSPSLPSTGLQQSRQLLGAASAGALSRQLRWDRGSIRNLLVLPTRGPGAGEGASTSVTEVEWEILVSIRQVAVTLVTTIAPGQWADSALATSSSAPDLEALGRRATAPTLRPDSSASVMSSRGKSTELLLAVVGGVTFSWSGRAGGVEDIDLTLRYVQVDNELVPCKYPVLLRRSHAGPDPLAHVRASMVRPAVTAAMAPGPSPPLVLEEASVRVQQLELCVEMKLLSALWTLVTAAGMGDTSDHATGGLHDGSTPHQYGEHQPMRAATPSDTNFPTIIHELERLHRAGVFDGALYIHQLVVHPLRVNLTVELNLGEDGETELRRRVLAAIGSAGVGQQRAPLRLPALRVSSASMLPDALVGRIIEHVSHGLSSELIYKLAVGALVRHLLGMLSLRHSGAVVPPPRPTPPDPPRRVLRSTAANIGGPAAGSMLAAD